MEERLLFETSESDSLEDILFKARNTIVKNRLRVNHIVIKPFKEKNEEVYLNNIEISAGFKIPSPNKINRIALSLTRKTSLREQTSREFIKEVLEKFGSDGYMGFDLGEQEEFPKDKYKFYISESYGNRVYEVKLPLKITKKDLTKLLEILEILKISYEIKNDTFKIIPKHPRKTLTYEIQADAYLWAIKNDFFPSLFSSSWDKDVYDGVNTLLSEFVSKTSYFKEDHKLTRTKYIRVEEQSIYAPLDKERISHIEKFAARSLGIQLNDRWEVYYYQATPKEKPIKSDDQNNTLIVE